MPASFEATRDSSNIDAWATGIRTFAQFHHRIDDFTVILDITMQHLKPKKKMPSVKAGKYYYNSEISGEGNTYMDEWGVGRLFWLFLRSLNGRKVVKCYERKLRYGFDFLPVVTFKNNNRL